MYKITILDNQLRIITCEMPHMESVAMGIWVGVGSRYETFEKSGISHFIEHLLFKGTAKRTGKEISQEIEGRGGILNAFTGEEYTCYYFKVSGKHFAHAFEILCDMYVNPAFSEEEIQKEREVILEEIRMYLDQPAQHVQELFSELLWPKHPLGKLIIGTPESLAAIQRPDICEHKNRYYIPQKTVIAVAGKITHEEVVEATKQHIQTAPSNEIPSFQAVAEDQKKPEATFYEKETEQFHVCLGVRSYPREHQDRYALRLLSTLLGENMSSRLFQEVREKHGLAYDIHSSTSRFYDTGSFTVSAGVEKKKLKKALAVILSELGKFKKDSVSDEELIRAKEYCVGQLVLGLEKTMNNMLWVGENLLCSDKVMTMQEMIDKIQEVDVAQIRKVAQDIFVNSKLNLALIGPVKNKSELLSELHF